MVGSVADGGYAGMEQVLESLLVELHLGAGGAREDLGNCSESLCEDLDDVTSCIRGVGSANLVADASPRSAFGASLVSASPSPQPSAPPPPPPPPAASGPGQQREPRHERREDAAVVTWPSWYRDLRSEDREEDEYCEASGAETDDGAATPSASAAATVGAAEEARRGAPLRPRVVPTLDLERVLQSLVLQEGLLDEQERILSACGSGAGGGASGGATPVARWMVATASHGPTIREMRRTGPLGELDENAQATLLGGPLFSYDDQTYDEQPASSLPPSWLRRLSQSLSVATYSEAPVGGGLAGVGLGGAGLGPVGEELKAEAESDPEPIAADPPPPPPPELIPCGEGGGGGGVGAGAIDGAGGGGAGAAASADVVARSQFLLAEAADLSLADPPTARSLGSSWSECSPRMPTPPFAGGALAAAAAFGGESRPGAEEASDYNEDGVVSVIDIDSPITSARSSRTPGRARGRGQGAADGGGGAGGALSQRRSISRWLQALESAVRADTPASGSRAAGPGDRSGAPGATDGGGGALAGEAAASFDDDDDDEVNGAASWLPSLTARSRSVAAGRGADVEGEVSPSASGSASIEMLGDSARTVLDGGLADVADADEPGAEDEAFGDILQRLALDNVDIDEGLARSIRRVLQLGTVLAGQRLTRDEIDSLPKVRFDSADCQSCAICLEPYNQGELLTSLRCSHFFHVDCLGSWFQQSSQCPLCRTHAD